MSALSCEETLTAIEHRLGEIESAEDRGQIAEHVAAIRLHLTALAPVGEVLEDPSSPATADTQFPPATTRVEREWMVPAERREEEIRYLVAEEARNSVLAGDPKYDAAEKATDRAAWEWFVASWKGVMYDIGGECLAEGRAYEIRPRTARSMALSLHSVLGMPGVALELVNAFSHGYGAYAMYDDADSDGDIWRSLAGLVGDAAATRHVEGGAKESVSV